MRAVSNVRSTLFVEVVVGRGFLRLVARELGADPPELAGVEEDPAALRTLVDRDLALDAPEVAHHHDIVRALRAAVALVRVDGDPRVALDVEQLVAERLGRLVDLAQLVVVEPDAAASRPRRRRRRGRRRSAASARENRQDIS
jgi:hypothetical protein